MSRARPCARSRSLGLLAVLGAPAAALALGASASASVPPSTPAESTPAESTPADSTPADSTPADSTPADSVPAGYVRLVDDTGFLTVVVPETWDVVDTVPAGNPDGSPRPWIFASTVELADFDNTWASGVVYEARPYDSDPRAVIAAGGLRSGCREIVVEPYADPIFTGFVQVGTSCGEADGTWNMIVANPADRSFTAVVQVQVESDDDQDALEAVLASFTYAGDPSLAPGVVVPSSVPGSSVPG